MKPFQSATIHQKDVEASVDELVELWKAGDETVCRLYPAASPEMARASMMDEMNRIRTGERIYLNDKYQVNVRPFTVPEFGGEWLHLSIKRIDKETIHDWRDLQEIKNMIVGPENEGVELYPAESRKVDSANQYHLWVMKNPEVKFPIGYTDRCVMEGTLGSRSKQRPFAKGHK